MITVLLKKFKLGRGEWGDLSPLNREGSGENGKVLHLKLINSR